MIAILKIKLAKRNDHQIKATFKDSDGTQVKEMILTFHVENAAELLFNLEKQHINLGICCKLFKEEIGCNSARTAYGPWKVASNSTGATLSKA
jgi:hypothetical protein